MSKVDIKFGTAGWRGIISDDFTFDNVRLVSQAIVDCLKKKENKNTVVIGYDPRFLSENFSAAVSEVFAANNINVLLSDTDSPTPAISSYIIKNKLAGGINITASHNPPEYSGIKFSPSWGGPALPETTAIIEENCRKLQKEPQNIKTMDYNEAVEKGIIKLVDLSEPYIKDIKEKIDTKLISEKIKLAYDPMHGAARTYLSRILPELKIEHINNYRDVLFSGHRPEPSEEYLHGLKDIVINRNYDIGIATDGDADRFGIIDFDGTYITPNQIMGLALYHLHRKGYRGVAVRSVMTSSFMDAIAETLGIEVVETPVGFKYIGDIFIKQEIIVGGEESGGLTIGGHLPEKDGIIACLLMAELVAYDAKPIGHILKELNDKVGNFITVRKNYKISQESMATLKEKLKAQSPEKIGIHKVRKMVQLDGYKFIMDEKNTWVGLRFSGTEPVVRVYIESSEQGIIDDLILSAEDLFSLKV